MFRWGLVQDLTEAFEQLSRLGTKLAPATASSPPSGAVAASSYTQLSANAQVHAFLSSIGLPANLVCNLLSRLCYINKATAVSLVLITFMCSMPLELRL